MSSGFPIHFNTCIPKTIHLKTIHLMNSITAVISDINDDFICYM